MLDVPKETNLKEIKSNVQLSHCHSSRVFKKAQKEVNNKCPKIIIRLEGGAKHPPRLEENPSYNMGWYTPHLKTRVCQVSLEETSKTINTQTITSLPKLQELRRRPGE